MNILITSGGRRADLVREFKKVLGAKGKVYITDRTEHAAASFFADGSYPVPHISDPGYISALKELVVKLDIQLLFSVIDIDLPLLAAQKDAFKELGCTVLISSSEAVAITADKLKSAAFFESIGIKTPQVLALEEVNEFPVFIKPAGGSGSKDAYRVDSPQDLAALHARISNPLILEFLEGTEYSIDCFCDFDGTPLNAIPRTRELTMSGYSVRSSIMLDASLVADAKKILEHLHIVGPSVLQCIQTTKGNYFFECNPRFGGGSILGMHAGGDFAGKIVALMEGKKDFTFNAGVEELSMAAYLDHVIYDKSGHIRS